MKRFAAGIGIAAVLLVSGCATQQQYVSRSEFEAYKKEIAGGEQEQSRSLAEFGQGLRVSNAFLIKLIEIDPQAKEALKAITQKAEPVKEEKK